MEKVDVSILKHDLTNKKINRLTCIEPYRINGVIKWKCLCECGDIAFIKTNPLYYAKTMSCGCYRKEVAREKVSGKNHHSWGGGKPSINGRGYKEFKYGKLRGVKEHRYVYEQYYGIKLLPHQNIHHINGDRLDNRIENLELWDTSQPSGQRIEDKIMFYKELYERYKDHPKYKDLF